MKKVVLGIVGSGLLVGAVAYFLSKKGNIKNNETNTNKEHTLSEDKNKKGEDVFEDIKSVDIDIIDSRTKAANSIYERHQEASKIIKESMDSIFNKNEKKGKHADELIEISNELDELYKEND